MLTGKCTDFVAEREVMNQCKQQDFTGSQSKRRLTQQLIHTKNNTKKESSHF